MNFLWISYFIELIAEEGITRDSNTLYKELNNKEQQNRKMHDEKN